MEINCQPATAEQSDGGHRIGGGNQGASVNRATWKFQPVNQKKYKKKPLKNVVNVILFVQIFQEMLKAYLFEPMVFF